MTILILTILIGLADAAVVTAAIHQRSTGLAGLTLFLTTLFWIGVSAITYLPESLR